MSVMVALGDTVKPPEPVGPREELHNALQWLARMTRSFAADAGSGELHIFFDAEGRRFLTPQVAPATELELALPDLVMQFLEDGALSPHAMDVDDKSSSEIEAWLLCEMLHRGFDRERFSKKLPYKTEHLLSGDERKYAPSTHLEDLRGDADAMVRASRILRAVEGLADGEAARYLLCWPETSAIGFLSPGRDGAVDLKVGFSLGDKRDGTRAAFFVAPSSARLHAMPSATLAMDDVEPNADVERVAVERLSAMMAKVRTSAAH